jgi:hypothetical protein
MRRDAGRILWPVVRSAAAVLFVLAAPPNAQASFMSPEVEDKLATFIALFVIFIVPVVLIVLFWMVHILPEKIAHKRNHPQFEAIRTLCLLSLVFGGLLWPIAWLWAYSKPVFHKMAYGTDQLHEHEPDVDQLKSAEHVKPIEEVKRTDAPTTVSVLGLHDRLARLEERGIPPAELAAVRADIDALEQKFVTHGAR